MTSVLDLAALGLTNGAWRNTCVENWHAEGRLSDGDMLRINTRTTHGIRQRLRGWLNECGFAATDDADVMDEAHPEDIDRLVTRIFAWLTKPTRQLPTGATLDALAGADRETYEAGADEALSGVAELADEEGAAFALRRAAAHGAGTCARWWGHPAWPGRIERPMVALDDPADEHWGSRGEFHLRLTPEPDAVRDRSALRRLLLGKPWELDSDSAQWLVSAGIGYARADVPGKAT
ncbi:hypothetical protein OG216_08865 [Streptomycetaceae bacterium NBC_01309]